jgi:hypothetical protein
VVRARFSKEKTMFDGKHLRSAFTCLAAAVLWSTADAALFRAYLSGTGNDTNPCTLPAPCRLLPAALNAVAEGGEIWMLDSANYNSSTVTIDKSVSILAAPGAAGSILTQSNGPAILIAADTLTISLRNVVIVPGPATPPGTHGVYMTGNSKLTIEGSLIARMPLDGISLRGGTVDVANTTIRNNGRHGVLLESGSQAEIASSRLLQNGTCGVVAVADGLSNNSASVSDSLISGNLVGVFVEAIPFGSSRIAVARSAITYNNVGLECYGGGAAFISIGASLIAHNDSAWHKNCSAIYTAGNNQFNNNGSPQGGELTLLPLQ